MTTLHTISRSPASSLLTTCSSVLQEGDAILFIEDGIYYCQDKPVLSSIAPTVKLFALKEDLIARGMLERNSADLEAISYDGFVQLCCDHDKVVSWF